MAAANKIATSQYSWVAFVKGTLTMYGASYKDALAHFTEKIRVNPRDAEAYYHRAEVRERLDRLAEAIEDYTEAIRFKPEAMTYNKRALINHRLHRDAEAIADFTEVIRLEPNAEVYNNRGIAKNNLGRYEEALADYTEAIRLKPDDAEAYTNRGNAKHYLGRYEEALADYTEAIRLKPDYAGAYHNRGFAKDKAARHEEAILDYDEAIRLKPDFAVAYLNRGFTKKKMRRYEEAILDFDAAIRLKPDFEKPYRHRADAKHNLALFAEALADYDTALRLKPDYAEALEGKSLTEVALAESAAKRLASAAAATGAGAAAGALSATDAKTYIDRAAQHYNSGRYEEAIVDCDTAIRLKSDNEFAYNIRGAAKASLNRNEEAILDYDTAIRLNPGYAAVYNNRGFAKNSLGLYEEAIADLNEAIRLEPNGADAYNNRGNAQFALKRCEEALLDYDEAIRLKPDYAEAYNNKGEAKNTLGRYEGAILDYSAAIRLRPNYATAYHNRGFAKYSLEQYGAAILDFNKALRLKPGYEEAQTSKRLAEEAIAKLATDPPPSTAASAANTPPTNARGWFERGIRNLALKRNEEAVTDFTEAIRLDPNYAHAYCNRAEAKMRLGRYEEVMEDFNAALRLKPDYEEALTGKRLIEEALGQSVATHEEASVAASAAGAGAVIASPTTDMSELTLTLVECKALIARQGDFALRDELELRASRAEVLPAVVLAQREAKRQVEQKWLAEHPELDDYYHIFKNMLCATLTGAMGIYAGMADSSAASALESKLQKGAKYFSKLFKFLPFVKDATAPLQAAIDKAISISHENKVTYLLRCFPDFDQASQVAEELARGIALAMREAIDRPAPAEGYRLVRALKEYAATAKRRAKNLFYVNNLDTPIKQRAYEDVHKVLLLMMDGTTLTRENLTVEHIVTIHLTPGEVLLPSPIAGAAAAVDVVEASTVTVATATIDGSSGGTVTEEVMTLRELLKAEQQRRVEMEANHRRMEERLKRIEADKKRHTERDVRDGNQALAYAAAETTGAYASHTEEFARIHTELGQHREALSELAVRTGGDVRPLETHTSAVDPLEERAQLFGAAPLDTTATVARTISAKDHHTLAMRKYLKGRYADAIADFNAAITSRPKYALAYYNRGRAYMTLKQNREALADFTEALRLKPGFEQASKAKALVESFRS